MITGIEGLPGSGKSYLAVELIWKEMLKGRMVVTNMKNLFLRRMAYLVEKKRGIPKEQVLRNVRIIETKDVSRFHKLGIRNCTIVLDEVLLDFFSRDWAKQPKENIHFFTQHRKYRIDFIYITQSIARIDATLRDMTAEFIKMRNCANWRFMGAHLPNFFLASHFAEDGKTRLRREYVFPSRMVYGFYDSWAFFDAGDIKIEPSNVVDLRPGAVRSANGAGAWKGELLFPDPSSG